MEFKLRNTSDLEGIKAYLDALPFSGKTYTVAITKDKKKRTLSQNALYHLWLSCISKETGNDVDMLHRYFAKKYLGIETAVVFGEKTARVVSTTTLSTDQFTEYLNYIQAEMAEMGIILPLPSDLYYDAFLEQYQP